MVDDVSSPLSNPSAREPLDHWFARLLNSTMFGAILVGIVALGLACVTALVIAVVQTLVYKAPWGWPEDWGSALGIAVAAPWAAKALLKGARDLKRR